MANEAQVIKQAKDHFEAMPGRISTSWPNVPTDASLPRYEFQSGPVLGGNDFVSAEAQTNRTYLFQINAVVASGDATSEDAINNYVQLVIDHFAFGVKYGDFVVARTPERGAPDDTETGEYRISITIRLQAITG